MLARLAFVGRAKSLGCTLEEIAGLMPEWDGGRCGPVQDQLRTLASAKLAAAVDGVAFTADLRRILATLGSHTPDGPCDAGCGCAGEPPSPPTPAATGPTNIACSLEPGQVPARILDWQEVMGHVTRRDVIDGGLRLELDTGTPMDHLAQLVGAEQSCCSFFAFAITLDRRGLGLEVRAPDDAGPVIESLFGAPAGA